MLPSTIETVTYKSGNSDLWELISFFLKCIFEKRNVYFVRNVFSCMCFGLDIDVLSVSMRHSVIFCIYEHILKLIWGFLRKIRRNVWNFENRFFVIVSSNWEMICSLSNRGDDVRMCHFTETDLGLIFVWGGIRRS